MEILFEDNQVIVAYKEVGLLSQADISGDRDILNDLKLYIKEKYNKPGAVYLGLVHRLDRNTSGVMVFARTSKAASRLSEEIREHKQFNKKYLAIVEGIIPQGESKTLKNNLLKNEDKNKSFVSSSKNAKEAILTYTSLDNVTINNKSYSLLDITLLTGRHHQIRCQLSHIGHPIAGDLKYGALKIQNNEYYLSSYSISFTHPTLKNDMTFNYFKSYGLFSFFSKDDLLKKYNLI